MLRLLELVVYYKIEPSLVANGHLVGELCLFYRDGQNTMVQRGFRLVPGTKSTPLLQERVLVPGTVHTTFIVIQYVPYDTIL